jgi:hypothetical protein
MEYDAFDLPSLLLHREYSRNPLTKFINTEKMLHVFFFAARESQRSSVDVRLIRIACLTELDSSHHAGRLTERMQLGGNSAMLSNYLGTVLTPVSTS